MDDLEFWKQQSENWKQSSDDWKDLYLEQKQLTLEYKQMFEDLLAHDKGKSWICRMSNWCKLKV